MRIMIVDDEAVIRDSLAQLPVWSGMGCEIVAAACNGREALESISLTRPDLIITDIRMPVMDGLELAEKVRMMYPSIFVIFVTAFGDFEYARHAIKLGVADFITKPVQTEEVILAVDLLKQGVRHLNEDMRLRQEKCLQALFAGERPDPADPAYAELCGRELLLMSVEVDNIELLHHTGKPVSMLALREMVCCMLKYHPFPYWTYLEPKGIGVLLIAHEISADEFKNAGIRMAREIVTAAEGSFGHTVSMGISDCLTSPIELGHAREEIRECLDYRMLLGKGSVVSRDVITILERQQMEVEAARMRELSVIIRQSDTAAVKDFLRSIYREMLSKGLNKAQVQRYATMLVNEASSIMEEYMPAKGKEGLGDVHKSLLSYDTLKDLMAYLESLLTQAALQCRTGEYHAAARVLKGVTDYLEDHYQGEITLTSLAQHLHMNHSYLSRLIKKETGRNFRDLLWEHRIEASKALLKQSGMKAYEAAYQVGFKDPAHYSQLFKRMVGVTPTEYRESMLAK
ncbi:AraC family transcriptional regulator [Paenibacillus sp. J23TS9]|uniref:response regulator transcription factor n=1 Tax=Paenibacillus sp. J23TS9 TaxID=2807193 RepID=UPI001B17338B|nr:response regulator [Paenibacillus sp. J23TS9]GIP29733.1 AraC family transcriptional regulator [Paenibacillus sp. J23TS9]